MKTAKKRYLLSAQILLTGFGIRDSVQNVTEYQYGEINLYDAEITFTDPLNKAMQEDFIARHGNIESALFLSVCNADMRETIEASFSSLNFVVVLIIICAGILAFIVLFNLININIGERIREIATIKVLGFFNNESSAYIFCEVNMLTAAGTLLGLLFGRFLHAFVMEQIRPDGICFDCRIMWYSYLFSIAITLVFALLVQTVMRIKLKKISMTELLKSIE